MKRFKNSCLKLKDKFFSLSHPSLFVCACLVFVSLLVMTFLSAYEQALCVYYEAKLDTESVLMNYMKEEKKVHEAETLLLTDTIAVYNNLATTSLGRVDKQKAFDYARVIAQEAERYSIDPLLVLAIISTESSFRLDAVSHKGAIGLMQILPATAFYISKKLDHVDIEHVDELFDGEMNLRLGVAYLAYLVDKTGSTEHAVIAYNYGPGNLKRAISKKTTLPKKYVSKVMRKYNTLVKNS